MSHSNDTPDLPVFRPDRSGIRKVLGDLEAEIMEIVWARPAEQGTTVRDVFEILYERRRLAYTTVMSTMARLAKKRLLRVDKIDHAYIYYPAVSEEELVSLFVGRILDDLLVNFSGVTFECLSHITEPDAAQRIGRLARDIQARKQRRASAPARSTDSAPSTSGATRADDLKVSGDDEERV